MEVTAQRIAGWAASSAGGRRGTARSRCGSATTSHAPVGGTDRRRGRRDCRARASARRRALAARHDMNACVERGHAARARVQEVAEHHQPARAVATRRGPTAARGRPACRRAAAARRRRETPPPCPGARRRRRAWPARASAARAPRSSATRSPASVVGPCGDRARADGGAGARRHDARSMQVG